MACERFEGGSQGSGWATPAGITVTAQDEVGVEAGGACRGSGQGVDAGGDPPPDEYIGIEPGCSPSSPFGCAAGWGDPLGGAWPSDWLRHICELDRDHDGWHRCHCGMWSEHDTMGSAVTPPPSDG
jgi:hypothetical protein